MKAEQGGGCGVAGQVKNRSRRGMLNRTLSLSLCWRQGQQTGVGRAPEGPCGLEGEVGDEGSSRLFGLGTNFQISEHAGGLGKSASVL